jgi:GDP-L-fucose synthase
MNKDSKIYIAGHMGLVGSAILRSLSTNGYVNLIYKTRNELDLTNQAAVESFFKKEKPEYVFLAAAKVGGIMFNKNNQGDFISENLKIQTNVIDSAYKNDCKKLIFLGSNCMYPKFAEQPIKEEYLLSGKLEPTNMGYAIAKIAGVFMCEKYSEQFGFNAISLMPCNLYGENDNFNIDNGHVLPSLIAKFLKAKNGEIDEVVCWGDGSQEREFIISDDLADASIFLMNSNVNSGIFNIGTEKDITVKELVETIQRQTGYQGKVTWDASKPNGTPKKKLDISKMTSLGWTNKTSLEDGIRKTIDWYSANKEHYKKI